jgi:hypothetical protein
MERNIQQLTYRIQLGEEMFMKHAHAAGEQSVPGKHNQQHNSKAD